MHPAVDAPIDIDSSWYGHLSLEDAPRVTISNTSGGDPFYKRSVQFAPLNSSDEGTYFISTRVRALDSEYLCQSSYVNESINISPSKCTTRYNGIYKYVHENNMYNFCHFQTCNDYKFCELHSISFSY